MHLTFGDVHYKSLSCVWLFSTLWIVASKLLCSWILQARIVEWFTMPSSRRSSWPRNWTHVYYASCIAGGFFTINTPWKASLGDGVEILRKAGMSIMKADLILHMKVESRAVD